MPELDLEDFLTTDDEVEFFNNAVPTTGPSPSTALSLPAPMEQTLVQLLPIANIQLTKDEEVQVRIYHEARLVLGAAGAAPMICAAECPIIARCPLAKIKKLPVGELCPFEANYVLQRFSKWCEEMSIPAGELLESERVTVSNLTYLDLQEQRCLSILAEAKNASLQSRSVKDIDVETGQAICWEDVIHINMQALNQIQISRRMIMRDFELTPEMKTKKNRWEQKTTGNDLSSKHADNADRLRRAIKKQATVIDVTAV